jgi:hypothetical protein
MKKFFVLMVMVLAVAISVNATLPTVTATLKVSNADGTFPSEMPDVTCSVTYMATPNPTPIIYSPSASYSSTTGFITWTVPQNSYIKVGCKACYGFTTPSNYAIATSNVILNDMVASTPPSISSVNTFATIDCPSGTDPVAETAIDTLTLTAGTGLTITGDSTVDSVTFVNAAPDQTVALTGAGITTCTGTYPNFTITSTEVDGSVTNEIQNIFQTVASQSGSTTANSSTDTLTVNGAGIASTAVSGDTLTITATEADTLATVTGRGATTTADVFATSFNVTSGNDWLYAGQTQISFTNTNTLKGASYEIDQLYFTQGEYTLYLQSPASITSNQTLTFPFTTGTILATTTGLKLDQTTPQTVANGIPDFSSGISSDDYSMTPTGLKYKTSYIFQTDAGFSNFAFAGTLPSGITTGVLNVSLLGGLSNLTSGMNNVTWGDDAGDIIDGDSYCTAIGNYAFAGTASGADDISEGTAIGYGAGRNNGGRFSTFLGYYSGNAGGDTPNTYDAVVCIGAQSQPNKAHQAVIGGNCSDDYIDEMFMNAPVMVGTDAPAEIALRTTNGTGTDKDGSDLAIKPGQSTGSGAGGVVNIYAGTTSTSGTTPNALTKMVIVDTTGMSISGNTVWHAGNDGTGSGLDADTVDGSTPLFSEVDGVVGNEVTDINGTTLTRSGTGTSGDPYKLALNLGNGNTWTVGQVIDGTADENQLRIQSNSTQNTYPFLVENSSGTDTFYTTNSGSVWVKNYILLDTGIIEQNTSGTTLTINGYQGSFTGAGPGVKINTPPMSGTTASTGLNVSSTNTKSANAHSVMSITPTYNQTSTASGTDLTINRTETAVGSGAQFLIDAQTGGASKFSVTNGGLVANRVKSITIPDSGGAGAAAYTINPEDLSVAAGAISSYIELTCSDADGCDITMGETDVVVGTILNVVNIGTNVCNFADTGGVSELAGAFAAGQYDSLSLRYATGTWVETGRSNN